MSEPSLKDLWNNKAEFRSEDPRYSAVPVYLNSPCGTYDGKLSVGSLKQGKIIGIYRYRDDSILSGAPHLRVAFSDDGLVFTDDGLIPFPADLNLGFGDPSVVVFDIQGTEHVFVFYEASLPQAFGQVIVSIGLTWSTDQGRTWEHHKGPLIEPSEIPNWGKPIFRGTSVPSAVLHHDHMHVWVYWSGLYGQNPNHSEVGAGYIGIVQKGTNNFLTPEQGGILQRRQDGRLQLSIDPGQRENPVMERGPFRWCSGAVDLSGNVAQDDDGYYTVFRGGFFSEGEVDDIFCAGLAKAERDMVHFTKWDGGPIAMALGVGVAAGISYPWLFRHGGCWYLYFVTAGPLRPIQSREHHYRLRLQWR